MASLLAQELDATFTIWNSVRSEYWLNELMASVMKAARRWCRGDQEVESDVTFTALMKLPSFVLKHEGGFSRWVSSLCAITRRRHRHQRITSHGRDVELDEALLPVVDDSFFDLTGLDDIQRRTATLLLEGHTLNSAASAIGTTPNALRNKLYRRRDKNPV